MDKPRGGSAREKQGVLDGAVTVVVCQIVCTQHFAKDRTHRTDPHRDAGHECGVGDKIGREVGGGEGIRLKHDENRKRDVEQIPYEFAHRVMGLRGGEIVGKTVKIPKSFAKSIRCDILFSSYDNDKVIGGKDFTALPKKKTRVNGSFLWLLPKTNLESKPYSPDGEYDNNFHKMKSYWWGNKNLTTPHHEWRAGEV